MTADPNPEPSQSSSSLMELQHNITADMESESAVDNEPVNQAEPHLALESEPMDMSDHVREIATMTLGLPAPSSASA